MGGEWIKHGVTINNVGPGVFTSPTAIANYGPIGEVLFGETEKMIPIGQLGDIDEHLVGPIIFMLTPAVAYTTGEKNVKYDSKSKFLALNSIFSTSSLIFKVFYNNSCNH